MIDIENKVIDTISQAFSGVATVSSVYVESPATFPWVYARQMSNVGYTRSYDNELRDHHVRVTFRLEYFSAKESGAKQEVKAMMQIGDNCMQGMKFRRTASGLIPNWDRTITRGYADYSAVVGEPTEVGGDTVFQIYR